jgi:two-component system response regulator RegX3
VTKLKAFIDEIVNFLEDSLPSMHHSTFIQRNEINGGKMPYTVLIYSNEATQLRSVSRLFELSGYKSVSYPNSQSPHQSIAAHKPDVIALAAEVVDANVLEMCKRLRAASNVPVIITPLHHDDVDEMSFLSAGADDYVARSRNQRILIARTDTLVRRWQQRWNPQVKLFTHHSISLNADARIVTVADKVVELTRTEFDLLSIFMENSHRVVHRQELLDRIWGTWYGDDHVLETHISRMRKKITVAKGPRVAWAVRGVGYRLASHESAIN